MSWQAVIGYSMDALSLGSLYALFALSISIVFGVMRLINFAQGSLVAAGAYTLAVLNGPFVVRVFALIFVSVGLSLIMERIAFRPLRNAEGDTLLVASFAVSVLVENVILLAFGSVPKGVALPSFFGKQATFGSVSFPMLDPIAIVVTVVVLILLLAFLKVTDTGLCIRAAAGDFTMARLLGVRANRVVSVAFALSGLLAAPAVLVFMGTTGITTPTVGDVPILAAFAAVIIGGIGSLQGSLVGGYLFGIATVALQATLPAQLRVYRDAFVFVVVLAVLAVRPNGLIPSAATRARV